MCGILGLWSPTAGQYRNAVEKALRELDHRGPNDRGVEWYETPGGTLAFAHTRLSIIDLSAGGHQPMHSPCGRWSMIYNGEIYNYRELRRELEDSGEAFATASDTEVLLRAWMRNGAGGLRQLIGMFAFAVIDRKRGTLTLARDAFGIKPLFYRHDDKGFAFASESKAITALELDRPRLNLQRAYHYLALGGYDDAQETFVEGIRHLPPAHWIELDLGSGRSDGPQRWWWPPIEERPVAFDAAAEELRGRFLNSVRLHLRSDVPLGAALSGGIDSSAVVCAMRRLEPDVPIHTFSFVAPDSPVNEERWADLVNRTVGAEVHKVAVAPEELAEDVDDMIRIQDEPFGGTSIYAQYRVFRLVREKGVTVTLDGQGADELLAGYHGYPGARLNSLYERHDYAGFARLLARWSRHPGRARSRGFAEFLGQRVPRRWRGLALSLVGRSVTPAWLDAGRLRDAGVRVENPGVPRSPEGRRRRLAEALRTALTDGGLQSLLRHGDRNAMRWSVESRVPFLTVPLAEFLLSLPENHLLSDHGETKHVFRAAMRGIVPDVILDRKDKIGFATPEQVWLVKLAPTIRRWIADAPDLPFVKRNVLQRRFDAALNGEQRLDGTLWRFINFYRWFQIRNISL
jgi:asparagine synthase (glutamine-hydrolysing)